MRYKCGRAIAVALLAAVALMMSLPLGARASVSGTSAGGLTAGAPQLFPGPAHVTSIACVDSDTCYAIGRDHPNAGPGELFTITDGTITNEQTLTGAAFMTDLACSPGGTCYAVGRASLDSRPELVLAISNGVAGEAQTAEGAVVLQGIACNTSGACYAVGSGLNPDGDSIGVIIPIVNGQIGPTQPVPGTVSMDDIDCPTADTCYALATQDTDSATLIVPVVDGQPGASQLVSGGYFRAIACPSADTCYASGYAGGLASANEGQGTGGVVAIVDGQPGPVQTVDAAGPLGGIVCPTSGTCLALGSVHGPSQGVEQSQGFPPRPDAIVPIVSGVPGSVTEVDSGPPAAFNPLTGGDCPTSQTCFVLTQDQIIPITVGGDDTLPPSASMVSPACSHRYLGACAGALSNIRSD